MKTLTFFPTRPSLVLVGAFLITLISPALFAQGVIGEWSSIETPPPPPLVKVTVEPKTTALLVLDFGSGLCNRLRTPRCATAIPHIKKLLDASRTHKMLVVYSSFRRPGFSIVDAIRPKAGDPIVSSGPDKFVGTDLDGILKSRGIKTVIITGVVANGAVLFTAFGAASHHYKVIVPVDTMPGRSAYAEQNAIWNLANDPGLGTRSGVTITSSDRVQF